MVFTSFKFLLFLTAIVIVYYILPPKRRWYALLGGSVVFYGIAGLAYLPFIGVTTVVSFVTALFISKRYQKLAQEKETADREQAKKCSDSCQKACRAYMVVALLITLGILVYTKFAGMLLDSLNVMLHTHRFSAAQIIVPLGISYYTFSTIGYVLDVYWQRYEAERNFFRYALYVMYFPHILQGPIARFDRLGVQFARAHFFDFKRVTFGMQLMMWGFFQKLVIADRVGIFVTTVYDSWESQAGAMLLVATVFYAVQIYTDFAGCVNIAHGMSQIFDITLEENFRQPYFSQSVAEFWRRWHITLGAWFKDYLYMAVAVSGWVKDLSKFMRKKVSRQAGKNTVTVASLIVVWLCTGIWHGTGWNYIIWGIWQGGIIIFSTLMEENFKKAKSFFHIKEQSGGWKRFCIARTFLLAGIIPRVITRAPSVGAAFGIFGRMIASFQPWVLWDGTLFEQGLNTANFVLSLLAILLLYLVSRAKEKGVQIRDTIAAKPLVIRWGIYYALFFGIVLLGIYGPGYDASNFVYMDF